MFFFGVVFIHQWIRKNNNHIGNKWFENSTSYNLVTFIMITWFHKVKMDLKTLDVEEEEEEEKIYIDN